MKNHNGLHGMKSQEWQMKKYPQQQSLKEAELLIGTFIGRTGISGRRAVFCDPGHRRSKWYMEKISRRETDRDVR